MAPIAVQVRSSVTNAAPAVDPIQPHDFSDVDPERRARVAQDIITTQRRQFQRRQRRPAALTAREALAALQFEAMLVWTAAHNIANGNELSEADLERLTLACRWIDTIAGEAI
jgi:hypothetical protein